MGKKRTGSMKPTGGGAKQKRQERRAGKFGGPSPAPKVKDAGVKKKKASPRNDKTVGAKGKFQKTGKSLDGDKVKDKQGKKRPFSADGNADKRKTEKEDTITNSAKHHKPNSDIIHALCLEWEKLRPERVTAEDRKKGVSALAKKVKGKVVDLGSNHKASRVIQAIIKHGTEAERSAIFKEITNPESIVALAKSAYGNFIVRTLFDKSPKKELPRVLGCLRGKVVPLAKHPCGTAVLEAAYSIATATQRSAIVAEFYGPEFALKAQAAIVKGGSGLKLKDALQDPGLGGRRAVMGHASRVLVGIWEKGMVASAYIHRVLAEYFQEAPASMVQEAVEALAGDQVLVRMMHTLDGAKAVNLLLAAASAKQRKKILKSMKDLVLKVALDEYGRMVILGLMDTVDDTVLMRKIVVQELVSDLWGVASDKHARLCLLHLLAPRAPRYLPQALAATLPPTHAPEDAKLETEAEEKKPSKADKKVPKTDSKKKAQGDDEEEDEAAGGIKKPLNVKRRELLSGKDGLASKLVDMCVEHAGEMLCEIHRADVLVEVMSGGLEHELAEAVGVAPMQRLYQAVAAAAHSSAPREKKVGKKEDDEDEEDEEEEEEGTEVPVERSVLVHYTGSRVLRRLALLRAPQPTPGGVSCFGSFLWTEVFQGKCSNWLGTHAEKVLAALIDCEDVKTSKAVKTELGKLLKPVTVDEWQQKYKKAAQAQH